jgi:epoxide hydrolase-like predicted phosphatase
VNDVRALVVDWGGVLTSPLQDTMTSWCETDGLDYGEFRQAMRDWLGSSYGDDAAINPIHALERGEIEVPEFERELAARLRTRDGQAVEATGLLTRMFSGFETAPDVATAVRRVKQAGRQTALLSNSWGNEYPREGWDEMFDVVVISGEVNLRKPEPEIYHLVISRLGLEPHQCVFVDDLTPNIEAANAVGMIGVRHVTPQQTLAELEKLFGLPLRG